MQLSEQQQELRARKIRGIFVHSASAILFTLVFGFLLFSIKPILLPIVLGTFFAYVFRPLLQFKGTPARRYMRAVTLIAVVTSLGYSAVRFVKDSLPSEKQKLEILVRLQYQSNLRYKTWMGLTEKHEGNAIYEMFGKELDPMMMKANDFLTLTVEQRKLFLKYVKGYNNEAPISTRYYDYFVANQKVIQEVEVERVIAAAQDHSKDEAKAKALDKKEGGIGHLMHLFTIWLVFPLTFMFIITDKGQIIHFVMKVVPNRYFELTMNIIDHVDDALGKYIRGTAMECALVGMTLIAGFWLVGLPLKVAVLVGLLGGLTNAIPFVGTLIACVVGAVFALIAEDITPIVPYITENNLVLAVIGVVMVAHLLDNAVFQPLVVGGAVNIHPLVVILGVFGGSIAFGFPGLLFAIPTIVITKVVVQQFFRGLRAYKII